MDKTKFREHQETELCLNENEVLSQNYYSYLFPKKKDDQLCFKVLKKEDKHIIETGYFIGADWIEPDIKHIEVSPKLNFNNEGEEYLDVDYLKMLSNCLKHQEAANLIGELIHIKWDQPQIKLTQQNDTLTPFIIVDFLNTVKQIVKKGLKKSYYKTTRKLTARVKGKLLIKQTIVNQIKTGTQIHNTCTYDEFGVNIQENKLLKKALVFIQQYMSNSPIIKNATALSEMINFISPPFDAVSDKIDLSEIKQLKSNTLFKEYDKAIKLAKLILRRFAFNISNTSSNLIPTPPFWIDMPLLFELHVLSLLKSKYGSAVKHHFSTHGNELDFLLTTKDQEMVIDAKYKPKWHHNPVHDDVRQVSGYARLKRVFDALKLNDPILLDCLIIYPNNCADTALPENLQKTEVKQYHRVYKVGVSVPLQ